MDQKWTMIQSSNLTVDNVNVDVVTANVTR